MMGGGARRKRGKSQMEIEREEKAERDRVASRIKGALAGKDEPGSEPAKKEAEQETQEPPGKEITKGYRWVAITGVLDHGQLRDNYREALKNPAVAHPHYRRLDLQRKTLQPDGTWSDWQDVDADKNLEVLDNLPEVEEELTPEPVRPEGLVDPLPFLKAGLWEKVHIASLVPKEKKELPPETPRTGGGMMGMPGMMAGGRRGMGAMMAGGMPGMMGGSGGAGMGMMGGRGMMGGGGMRMMMEGGEGGMGGAGMMGGSGMAGMMGMGMMGGPSETVGNYWKSEEKKVMIRALDFTPQPDNAYRYRVRIVVFNPNFNRQDVSPGVDTKSQELKGPWSQETDQVHMPPDVQPYAVGSLDPNPRRDRQVRFEVVRFNPADGWTVPRHFEASAGEVIGDRRTAEVPASDGSGTKSKTIDFSSRQVVLDVKGGGYQQLPARLVGTPIERPALAVLLRPDGSVVVHNEADDAANEVRKDIDANYRHEIKESSNERKNSQGSGYMGMMGGMGGMGGMMEMMRGGAGGRGRR